MALSNESRVALDAVLKRAAVDSDFRRWLLDDPRRALAAAIGDVPKDLRVKFIEKPDDLDALIVLPDRELTSGECGESGELEASELDAVAGGEGGFWDPLLE